MSATTIVMKAACSNDYFCKTCHTMRPKGSNIVKMSSGPYACDLCCDRLTAISTANTVVMKTADQIIEEVRRERSVAERHEDFVGFEAMNTLYKKKFKERTNDEMDDHAMDQISEKIHEHFGDHYDVSARLIAYEKMEVEYKAMKKAIEDKKAAQKAYYEKRKEAKAKPTA